MLSFLLPWAADLRKCCCDLCQRIWLPRWLSGKEFACQCRRHRFEPWVRKIPWKRKWQPTPVFLSRKFHGQRCLAGYSPQGCKELDTTEQVRMPPTHTPTLPPPPRAPPGTLVICKSYVNLPMRWDFFSPTFPFEYSHMERNLDSAPSLQIHCYYNVRHLGENAASNMIPGVP